MAVLYERGRTKKTLEPATWEVEQLGFKRVAQRHNGEKKAYRFTTFEKERLDLKKVLLEKEEPEEEEEEEPWRLEG
eukprot:jgi/Mesen1/2960/ME000176S02005